MKRKSILLEKISVDQLTTLIEEAVRSQLEAIQRQLHIQSEKDDLMTRDQVLELLQINASTLWHWQNKKRITVYKYSNKCYYKRSEILASITPLNK